MLDKVQQMVDIFEGSTQNGRTSKEGVALLLEVIMNAEKEERMELMDKFEEAIGA